MTENELAGVVVDAASSSQEQGNPATGVVSSAGRRFLGPRLLQ